MLEYAYRQENDWQPPKIPVRHGNSLLVQQGGHVIFNVVPTLYGEDEDPLFGLDELQWRHIRNEGSIKAFVRDGVYPLWTDDPASKKALRKKCKKYVYDCNTGTFWFTK